jgi:pimeloyl-ACP methyl ester carboxylesterase
LERIVAGDSEMMFLLLIPLVLFALGAGLALFTRLTSRRVEATLPPAGGFVDVPGARLHLVERGEGPSILLVHGLAGQLGDFTYAVVDLLAPQYRVVAVDRPGSGYSVRAPGASASLGAQADAIAALIDALKLGRPLVVGHSFGGAVALALAQRHPERVAGLALLAPLTHPVDSVAAPFRGLLIESPWLRALVGWTLATPANLIGRGAVLRFVFAPDGVPPDFDTRGGNLLGLRPGSYIAASADMVAAGEDLPAMARRYGALKLPVSILFGRGDRLLSPQDQGESLAAEIPGAELVLVEGGHMLPIIAPQRTAEFIREAASRAFDQSRSAGARAPNSSETVSET